MATKRARRASTNVVERKPVEIIWSERARFDLCDIHDYIAADDPVAAERWIEKLATAVQEASWEPTMGRVVPERGREDLREVFVRSYRIVYRLGSKHQFEVVTIFEGHRLPRGV